MNAAEKGILRKKLRRKEMLAFFEKLTPTVIGIEACGASHHWARLLRLFGHEVKLIRAQLVKPYVKRGVNDTTVAEALCEAMSRPTMRFVPIKTAEQLAALMLVCESAWDPKVDRRDNALIKSNLGGIKLRRLITLRKCFARVARS